MAWVCVDVCFFFSSRRRHTRCALVTGVQTCALPIYNGMPVSSGRVADFGAVRIRTALREIVTRFDTPVVLLPSQDIILYEIAPEDRAEITAVLRAHGVTLDEDLSPVQRWSMACPALPTCGLAQIGRAHV